MRAPVAFLAGGSSSASADLIASFADVIVEGFSGFSGTLISGGTRIGVSAIAGTIGQRYAERIHLIGYLPDVIPADVEVDEDRSRFHELRRTSGRDFTELEPVQAWWDILTAGIPPSGVRMLGIGGGRISAVEYDLAVALGAACGLLEGSGGSADRLLADPCSAERVTRLVPRPAAITRFLE